MTSGELLLAERSDIDFEMNIKRQNIPKSLSIYRIPAEFLKHGEKIFYLGSLKLLILFGIRSNYLRNGCS